jgi:hypothetical protein
MEKRKTGLHKQVSTIFDGVPLPKDGGVPLPKNDGVRQPSDPPAPQRPDYEGHPKADKGRLEPTVSQKPSAPSHLTPTTPKPQKQQPVEIPPEPAQSKAAPPQPAPPTQPDADAIIKTLKQIPWQQTLEKIKTTVLEIVSKVSATKPGVSATKQKTMAVLVPVLFIVLIFVFTRVLSTPGPQITEAQSLGPTNTAAASNEIDWQIPKPYPTTLRDPTQFGSVTTARSGASGLIVKGIVYSKDNPAAVIGSQILHEGDKVLGVTIVKINEKSIDFEMNGKRWTQKVQR